jgi:hypothetical protein
MNLLATLGIYASVLKERGEPLHYPGSGISAMLEATDTTILAECAEWSLNSPTAQNQTFNLTNGEFFSLREEWPHIAKCLGMETSFTNAPLSFRESMPSMSDEWDTIRQKYSLKSPPLKEFLGQSGQFSDFIFRRKEGTPSAMSCIKVRRAGFHEFLYADEMFEKWFARYRDEGLLPTF